MTSPAGRPPTAAPALPGQGVEATRRRYREIYEMPGLYDRLLIPHYFDGGDDVALARGWMERWYGPVEECPGLAIAELGCGTGRMTTSLAPYARHLRASDYSPSMIDSFTQRFPAAEAVCQDTRLAVHDMLHSSRTRFDVVAAFWSLSYPLMDCLEQLGAHGIEPKTDTAAARDEAVMLVRDLVRLLAPGGHLLTFFFDADTVEQQLVTRAWQKIAPFPGSGRGYTREILLSTLRAAENSGDGHLHVTRLPGVAVAPNQAAARAWFTTVHFKSLHGLADDPQVLREVDAFVECHTAASGEVLIPSGTYVIDFRATAAAETLRPLARRRSSC